MSEHVTTFVDAVLVGQAAASSVDDWVDRWADAGGEPNGVPQSLDEFLGFSSEEGALWAEKPSLLRFIVIAHDRGKAITEVITSRSEWALAARAAEPAATEEVISWLIARGYLDSDA